MGTTWCPVTLSQGKSLGKPVWQSPLTICHYRLWWDTPACRNCREQAVLCLKLLCSIFLSWNDHYLRNSLHSRCE